MELAVELRERVAPTVLAHEQTLPVSAELAGLFAEQALVRGRTLACVGPAATSTAMTLVAAAVAGGAWLAVVDVPTFGLDAASEAGIALERVVAVSSHDAGPPIIPISAGIPISAVTAVTAGVIVGWPDLMAAVVDGFEVVVANVPPHLPAGALRKLTTRIRRRGAVVVLLGDVGAMACDGVIESTGIAWSGLGNGFGRLSRRTVDLQASGRRLPGRHQCRVTLCA